ncbi:MAG: motility associated factor glycosyltransferase family protein, partial [Eubacteriales bacterium]
KNYKGPKLVGGCHENLLRWVEKTLNEPKGLYDLGPSVANVAFGLAKNFGCNPIILVGQDLAYTDNKSHAQGTAYEYMTIEDYRGRDIIEVEGVDGHPVLTDRVMFAFLRKFEMTIAASRETHTVIDATEGGAKIPGTYIMPLSEAIKKYCQPLIDADNKISGIVDSYTPPDQKQLVKIIKEIKNLHNRLNVLSTEAKQGVLVSQKLQKLYRSGLPGPTELHKILKKLNEIDGRIRDLRETTELFVLMFQKGILNVKQKTNSKIDGESEIEKGRRVADNSVELYRGIKESADRAYRMVGKAVSELEILFDLRGVD